MSAPEPVRPAFGNGSLLYVAGYGAGPGDGLHVYRLVAGQWEGKLLAGAAELSALAHHPLLPVVYGVSGSASGTVSAWDVSGDTARLLGATGSGGAEPCHVAVHPAGHVLSVANYASGTLALVRLRPDGAFDGDALRVPLEGSGTDPERQEQAHPHMAAFGGDAGNTVQVVDLGADVVHRLALASTSTGTSTSTANSTGAGTGLAEDAPWQVPPGTGPRHLAALPGGRLALSGELAATVLVRRTGGDGWTVVPSTGCTGPARTRSPRNYPGDIQASADGRYLYCANRGYDTIATFAVDGNQLTLVAECDAGARWPQHLLVSGHELLVAGRDGDAVVSLPLTHGIPGPARTIFECPGPSWLLAAPAAVL